MKKLHVGDKCKYGHILTEKDVMSCGHVRCKVCQCNTVKRYYSVKKVSILKRLKSKWDQSTELKLQNKLQKRKQYQLNPGKFKERRKIWRSQNLDKIRTYHTQPDVRIHSNISRAIRQAMKDRKNGRMWESIVGYTLNDLLNHLESRFIEGMTFENYGEWEIDHIMPRNSFDFSKDDSIKKCWAIENLQPLWMRDNRSKWANVG